MPNGIAEYRRLPAEETFATSIVLGFLVLSSFDLPRYFIDIFGLPLPPLGGNPPYMMPFVFLISIMMWRKMVSAGLSPLAIDSEDWLFIFALFIWVNLEIFHGARTGQIRWEVILTNCWLFFFYFTFKLIHRLKSITQELEFVSVLCASAFSLAHLGFYGLSLLKLPLFGGLLVHHEISMRNGLSFLSLLAIHLLLNYCPPAIARNRFTRWIPLLGLNTVVIFVNHTRGVIILLGLLFLLRLLNFGSVKHRLLTLAVIVTGGLLVINFGYGARVRTMWAPVAAAMDYTVSTVANDEMVGWDDDTVSTYSRVRTNLHCLKSVYTHPLIGIGLGAAFEIRVAGYMTHTYFLLPLVAYGLLGMIPMVMFFVRVISNGFRVAPREAFATAFLLFGAMAFVNDLFAWFSILVFLINCRGWTPRAKNMPVNQPART